MGGDSDLAYEFAVEMTRAWSTRTTSTSTTTFRRCSRSYAAEDSSSGSSRTPDATCTNFSPTTSCRWTRPSSRVHGKVKPHPTIFQAVLDGLEVGAEHAAMVGDSPEDDLEGARALGMRAFLVDREGVYPEAPDRLPTCSHSRPRLGSAAVGVRTRPEDALSARASARGAKRAGSSPTPRCSRTEALESAPVGLRG